MRIPHSAAVALILSAVSVSGALAIPPSGKSTRESAEDAASWIPREWFITTDTTWTVCASGCKFTSPLNAWHAALAANFAGNPTLTISISDGNYDIKDQLFTNTPKTKNVHIIGNTKDQTKVKLNFTNTKGRNQNGFVAYNGGLIGLIDGVTIQQPSDGSGALASKDSKGRFLWNDQSYGAGVQAYGASSNIQLGSHVDIHWFYYSVVADNNGGVDAPNGGVKGYDAGDVNFMARGGGVIVCTPCLATRASDYTHPSLVTLGSNFDAERGGTLYVDGSTAQGGMVSGLNGLTGGHIWGHDMHFLGGMNGGGIGVWMGENSSGEFTGSKIEKYNIGVSAQDGGMAVVNGATIARNVTGINIDSGYVKGDGVFIKDNTTGINVINSGKGLFYNTYSKMSGNKKNFLVQSSGRSDKSGSIFAASSLNLD